MVKFQYQTMPQSTISVKKWDTKASKSKLARLGKWQWQKEGDTTHEALDATALVAGPALPSLCSHAMLFSALSLQVNLLIPIAYLAFWAFLLVFSLYSEPVVCGVGLIIIFTGVPVFFLGVYWRNKPKCVNRLIGKHCHRGSVHSSGPVLVVCKAQPPLSPHQCRDLSKPSHHWHAQPSDPHTKQARCCLWMEILPF